MFELENVLVPQEGCPVREVDEGFVILAQDGETTHSLDGLGAFIWRRFDGKKDLAAILADVVAEYDVPTDQATKDLLEFVEALHAAGLIEKS
ncbi:MAG: PqqD family protein [bacterium]|nr:PqqD family protein [bacterium]